MKRKGTLPAVALIMAANILEQRCLGIPMIEFYFGLPLSELGSLTPVMRMGVSLAPVGFVVVPCLIGATYLRLAGQQATEVPFSVALSFFGHGLYVMLVVMLHVFIDLYFVSIGVSIVVMLILVNYLMGIIG